MEVPMYNSVVLIAINVTDDKLYKLLKKAKVRKTSRVEILSAGINEGADVAWCISHEETTLIRFFTDKPPVDTVVHELLHAAIHILRYVGIPLTSSSEEAYTYLLDNLVGRYYKFFKSPKN